MSVKNVAENLGSIMSSKASSMVHNLDGLQKQSLILASLVLVLSRSAVAKSSSDKAKGTPEAPYRYRESVRTYIREICGWTFGFVVLRQLQKGIQWGLGKWLNIRTPKNQNEFSIFKAVGDVWKTGNFTKFTPIFTADMTPIVDDKTTSIREWLLKAKPHQIKEATPFLRNFYKHAPIALASIPTVILAGALLERGTRNYSDPVANFFSKHGKSNNATKPGLKGITANPTINPALSSPAMLANCPPQAYNNARFTGMPAAPWPTQPAYGRLGYPGGYA